MPTRTSRIQHSRPGHPDPRAPAQAQPHSTLGGTGTHVPLADH